MEQLLIELSRLGPVVTILVVAIIYFLRKEKGYKLEITELNKEIKDNEKESLLLINRLANTLDKLSTNKEDVVKEIASLKEFITLKLEKLKD